MFEELIFCAAHSQELSRKASCWDCCIARWRKQRPFLLLCNIVKRHGLSNVHLGIYSALNLPSNCPQNKRCFWFEAPVLEAATKNRLIVN